MLNRWSAYHYDMSGVVCKDYALSFAADPARLATAALKSIDAANSIATSIRRRNQPFMLLQDDLAASPAAVAQVRVC